MVDRLSPTAASSPYQRDQHLRRVTDRAPCSIPVFCTTNRRWPTHSSSSQRSFPQVRAPTQYTHLSGQKAVDVSDMQTHPRLYGRCVAERLRCTSASSSNSCARCGDFVGSKTSYKRMLLFPSRGGSALNAFFLFYFENLPDVLFSLPVLPRLRCTRRLFFFFFTSQTATPLCTHALI